MPNVQMRCFWYAWKESLMSLKPIQVAEEPISKTMLFLQLMKNPFATINHKYSHSLQPMMIDHVENDQEDRKGPHDN